MKRIDTDLPGVCIIEPNVFSDTRGFFLEGYNRQVYADLGIACDFCQDNHSCSRQGVLRGLHLQLQQSQSKLIHVVRGAVFDVAVDLRRGSPTFGRWTGAELSAANKLRIFVPRGFAHGFLVLSAEAEFCYKVDHYYAPQHECGVIWNDPDIGIRWPDIGMDPLLSPRDMALPRLKDLDRNSLPRYAGAGA